MKKVLMIEPNWYHFEVVPGYAYYFERLGYTVDIMLKKHENLGNEFFYCNFDYYVVSFEDETLLSTVEYLDAVMYYLLWQIILWNIWLVKIELYLYQICF